MRKSFITGLAGTELTVQEAAFLARERPAGLIIFARNVDTPEQLKRLIGDACGAIAAEDTLVLVDQEGGRVQRLSAPYWRKLPAASTFADRIEAAHRVDEVVSAACTIARLTAHDLRAAGINVNCVPCADVPASGAHDIIGTRTYGSTLETIVPLARAVAEAHMTMGVLPVLKHLPGHGRATVDSHLALPVVNACHEDLAATDFAAFYALRDLPAAMTAHVVYSAIDPTAPATTSAKVIAGIIRGEIDFTGLLMSDDLSMQALQGSIGERAGAAISAGCDLALHCNGNFAEMVEVAAAVPVMQDQAQQRFARCAAIAGREPAPFDVAGSERVLADHMEAAYRHQ